MKIVNHMQMAYYPLGTMFSEYCHAYGTDFQLKVMTAREEDENSQFPLFYARDAVVPNGGNFDYEVMKGDYSKLSIPNAYQSTKYGSCNDQLYMIIDHDYVDQLVSLLRYQLDNVVEVIGS